MKQLFDDTLLKFFLVGIVNTIVGTGTMFLLYNLVGCSYWVSSAANYLAGGVVSYFLNKHFTFHNKDASPKQVLRFVANIATCWFLAYGLSKPLMRYLLSGSSIRIQENLAMVGGMCLYSCMNYLGQRFFVFCKPKEIRKENERS